MTKEIWTHFTQRQVAFNPTDDNKNMSQFLNWKKKIIFIFKLLLMNYRLKISLFERVFFTARFKEIMKI